jgi:hypothetical protein
VVLHQNTFGPLGVNFKFLDLRILDFYFNIVGVCCEFFYNLEFLWMHLYWCHSIDLVDIF